MRSCIVPLFVAMLAYNFSRENEDVFQDIFQLQRQHIQWSSVCLYYDEKTYYRRRTRIIYFLCRIGLGIYGDSNSESEEEQNEHVQTQNNDSDEELIVCLPLELLFLGNSIDRFNNRKGKGTWLLFVISLYRKW